MLFRGRIKNFLFEFHIDSSRYLIFLINQKKNDGLDM